MKPPCLRPARSHSSRAVSCTAVIEASKHAKQGAPGHMGEQPRRSAVPHQARAVPAAHSPARLLHTCPGGSVPAKCSPHTDNQMTKAGGRLGRWSGRVDDLGFMAVLGSGRCAAAAAKCLVLSDSLRLQGQQPARLLCPWDAPGRIVSVFNSC